MIGKDWTPEQIKAAAQKLSTEEELIAFYSLAGPFGNWLVHRELEALEIAFAAGNRGILLLAIAKCAEAKIPIPGWAASAYLTAFNKTRRLEVKSWDDAFGRPFGNRHIDTLRVRERHRFQVWNRISTLLASPNPPAIDRQLFEQVGKELGIGSRVCSDLYYEAKGQLEALLPKTDFPEK